MQRLVTLFCAVLLTGLLAGQAALRAEEPAEAAKERLAKALALFDEARKCEAEKKLNEALKCYTAAADVLAQLQAQKPPADLAARARDLHVAVVRGMEAAHAQMRLERGLTTRQDAERAKLAAAEAAIKLAATEVGAKPDRGLAEIRNRLAKKVTFEFADTPFGDAIQFVNQLANVNFVVQPAAAKKLNQTPVSLKVNDMELETALKWLCKLAGADYRLEDQAVHIFIPDDGAQKGQPPVKPGALFQKKVFPFAGGRMRVKLASGAEVEAEMQALERIPGLARDLFDSALDRARDGLLVYVVPPNDPMQAPLGKMINKYAPEVSVAWEQWEGEQVLLVLTSKNPVELRRAQTLANAMLRPKGPPGDAVFMREMEMHAPLEFPGGGWNFEIRPGVPFEIKPGTPQIKGGGVPKPPPLVMPGEKQPEF